MYICFDGNIRMIYDSYFIKKLTTYVEHTSIEDTKNLANYQEKQHYCHHCKRKN